LTDEKDFLKPCQSNSVGVRQGTGTLRIDEAGDIVRVSPLTMAYHKIVVLLETIQLLWSGLRYVKRIIF